MPWQTYGKITAWLGGALLFLMVIAAWSRLSTMKETPQAIRGGTNALANLFKGVLK